MEDSSEEIQIKRCLFCGELIQPEDLESFQKTGRCLRCQAKVEEKPR